MRTISMIFKVDGKNIKRTAILKDDLSELSRNKKNQCDDIIDECSEDGYWSLIFCEDFTTQYEVEFEYDNEEYRKTLKPIKCIVWVNDIIDDEVNVTVKIS